MMCVGIYVPIPHENKRRMTSKDGDIMSDLVDSEWTEHVSNSHGRKFFYNNKLDMK